MPHRRAFGLVFLFTAFPLSPLSRIPIRSPLSLIHSILLLLFIPIPHLPFIPFRHSYTYNAYFFADAFSYRLRRIILLWLAFCMAKSVINAEKITKTIQYETQSFLCSRRYRLLGLLFMGSRVAIYALHHAFLSHLPPCGHHGFRCVAAVGYDVGSLEG